MDYWNNLLVGLSSAFVLIYLLFRFDYLALGYKSQFNIFTRITSDWIFIVLNRYCFPLLLLMAILVRVWEFGDIPAGFNQDGAMASVDAKALADYGTDRFGMKYPIHFTAWGYGQMSVLLSYLMVPFIKVAGLNEITARLPILIVSLFGLLAFYGLVKNLLGRTAGLIALFLIAINPWHIMQSRWALDCNLFPHLFLIGCYFLYMATFRRVYLFLSMIFFALCMYSYGVAFVTVPIFLMLIAIYSFSKKIFNLKEIFLSVAVYFFLSGPILAVMIINFLRLPSIETPLFTIPFFPDSVRSGDILFFSSNIKDQFFNNLNAFIYVVLKQEPDLPWNAIDNFGTYYQFSLPFVLLGLFLVIKRSFIRVEVNQSNDTSALSSQFIYFMFLSGLIIGILTGLIIASVNVNRINIIFYFIVFLIALSVYEIIKSIRSISFVILPLYFLCFIFFCHYYYGTWAREIGPYYFSGMADALKEAKKIDTPRYYITVNSQGNGAKAVSEILTLFHHRIDAKYYQGVEFGVEEETLSADTIAGNKYALPYTERYRYVDPSVMLKNPQEKAVYIVNSNERSMFSTEYFKILDFEGYALVVPYSLSQ